MLDHLWSKKLTRLRIILVSNEWRKFENSFSPLMRSLSITSKHLHVTVSSLLVSQLVHFPEWRDALWQQRVWNCFLDSPKICFTALLDWFRNLIPPLIILEDSKESGYFKTKFACSLIDCASGLRKKKKRKVLWLIAPCRLPHPPNPPTPPHLTPTFWQVSLMFPQFSFIFLRRERQVRVK